MPIPPGTRGVKSKFRAKPQSMGAAGGRCSRLGLQLAAASAATGGMCCGLLLLLGEKTDDSPELLSRSSWFHPQTLTLGEWWKNYCLCREVDIDPCHAYMLPISSLVAAPGRMGFCSSQGTCMQIPFFSWGNGRTTSMRACVALFSPSLLHRDCSFLCVGTHCFAL